MNINKSKSANSSMPSFKTTDAERELIQLIVQRAQKVGAPMTTPVFTAMDITACHCNGTPLDLQKLLDADDFNFIHDIAGIRTHLDRNTGKLTGFFSPRCSLPGGGQNEHPGLE